MVAFVESDIFQAVDKWETTTSALGGVPDSPMNTPLARLVNRSRWLRNRTGLQGDWDASIEDPESLGNALRPVDYADGRKYRVTAAGFPFGGKQLEVGDVAEFYANGTGVFVIKNSVAGGVPPLTDVWDMSPVAVSAVATVASEGTIQTDSADNQVLIHPTSISSSTITLAHAASATPIDGTVQWMRVTANLTTPEIYLGGMVLHNDGATLADIRSVLLGGTAPTGTCTWAALVCYDPLSPTVLAVIVKATGVDINTSVPIDGTILSGDVLYFGVNTSTGGLVFQQGSNAIIDVSGNLGPGSPYNVPLGQGIVPNAIVSYGVTTPTAASDLHFDLSPTGRTGFSSVTPPSVPVGAADGKRYLVTAGGPYGAYTTKALDVVEFRNSLADLVVTRVDPNTDIVPWDLVAHTSLATVVPDSFISGSVTGTGPYVFTTEGPLSGLAQAGVIGAPLLSVIGSEQNTDRYASFTWPDLSGYTGSLQAIGFALMNEDASYADFVALLTGGTPSAPLYVAYAGMTPVGITFGTFAASVSQSTGSIPFTPTAGEQIRFSVNMELGSFYLGSTTQGMLYIADAPTLPTGKRWKIMFFTGHQNEYAGQPANQPLPITFTFNETDGVIGFAGPVTTLPSGVGPNFVLEATSAGQYQGKSISVGDLAIVRSDSLSIAHIPQVSGGVQPGDSVLVLTNPAGPSGLSTRTETSQAISDHMLNTSGHQLATTTQPGFMSASDKTALISASAAGSMHEWRPSVSTLNVIGSSDWGHVAYSPKLNRLLVSRTASTTGYPLAYSDNGGVTWAAVTMFGTFSSYRGPVYWVAELDKFVAFLGGNAWVSTDGINWTGGQGVGVSTVYSFAWSPEKRIGVVAGYAGATPAVSYSTDLETWTQVQLTVGTGTQGMRHVAWSPKLRRFVAIPYISSDPSVYSSDGINWSNSPYPMPSSHWSSMTWAEELGMFVAVAAVGFNNPSIAISRNGLQWTGVLNPYGNPNTTIPTMNSVAWSPELGVLLAVGDSGANWSSDGENWQSTDSDGTTLGVGQLYGKGVAWVERLNAFISTTGTTIRKTGPDAITGRGYDTSNLREEWIPLVTGLGPIEGDVYRRKFRLVENVIFGMPTDSAVALPIGARIDFVIPAPYRLTFQGTIDEVVRVGNPNYADQASLIKTGPGRWLQIYSGDRRTVVKNVSSVDGTLTLNLAESEFFRVSVSENIHTIILQNPPMAGYGHSFSVEFTQSNGGTWTVTWPAPGFRWNTTIPSLPTGNGAVALLEASTRTDNVWDVTLTPRNA